jgi:hypothetical protein
VGDARQPRRELSVFFGFGEDARTLALSMSQKSGLPMSARISAAFGLLS